MVDQEQHQTMEGVLAAYPARPGEPDCVYYLNHGLCGYGLRCRFNHPPLPGNLCTDQVERQYPERVEQPDCQYYTKTGVCKFGTACKYHHPSGKLGSPVQLNSSGLPIRLGKGECMHYASTGSCKFGLNCKFHHPQPEERCSSAVSIPSFPLSTYSPLSSFCAITPTHVMARGSYIPGLTSYTPIVVSPHWAFKGPHSPTTPLDGIEQTPTANIKTARKVDSAFKYSKSRVSSICEDEFPEREGQPECQYYLKTGDCRFGAFCKFHHPKGRTALASLPKCFLNVIGLPLRPGQPHCSYYVRYGICKFGPTCKFDHPILLPLDNATGVAPVLNMTMGTTCGNSGANVSDTLLSSCSGDGLHVALEIQRDGNITVGEHEEIEDSRN